MSWAPALVWTLGVFVVGGGILGAVSEWRVRHKKARPMATPISDSRSSLELFKRLRSQR